MAEPLGKRYQTSCRFELGKLNACMECAILCSEFTETCRMKSAAHALTILCSEAASSTCARRYVTTWNTGDAGDALRATMPQAISAPVQVDDAAAGMSEDDKYANAYKYAGNLMRTQDVSERRAAELAHSSNKTHGEDVSNFGLFKPEARKKKACLIATRVIHGYDGKSLTLRDVTYI